MMQRIQKIAKEKGQGMVEYGVILAVVVAIGIALLNMSEGDSLAQKINTMFGTSIDKVTEKVNGIN